MPFFLNDGAQKRKGKSSNVKGSKRKTLNSTHEAKGAAKRKKILDDEVILSDEEYSDDEDAYAAGSGSDGEYEDSKDKEYRQAKDLLDQLIAEGDLGDEDGDSEEEAAHANIGEKLKEVASIKTGTFHRKVANKLEVVEGQETSHGRHRFTPLSVAFSPCAEFIFSTGKDSQVVKYSLKKKQTIGVIRREKANGKMQDAHSGHIFAVAVSPDGKYVATGGVDCLIKIWDASSLKFLKDLKGHLQPITSLCFRLKSTQLFSSSKDRMVKLWDLEQMGLLDTMFGHQDAVLSIDCLNKERVLSCGGQDRSVRLWKVDTESQLVLNGSHDCGSIDCVAMLNEDHFVSGSADGSLCVWSIFKKKPTTVKKCAHDRNNKQEPFWIVSVAALPFTDLVASGSNNGELRFWRVADDYKTLLLTYTYEMKGFINQIRFSNDGNFVSCATGQEHKFGRWWVDLEARNKIFVLPLTYGQEEIPHVNS
ncbi:unnamed protein product, partial [Mesorhabditis belari]|uniref:U3 small nucleolar RNA-interacting protein 2 n=1 Tax=Mesorhabditis belari TaxID=2138241 RepID=A0AAF3EII1_9BILA